MGYTREETLWEAPAWELMLLQWADYQATTGKPVRWQPDIRDRILEILQEQAQCRHSKPD